MLAKKKYHQNKLFAVPHLVIMPFVYAVAIPLVLLDVSMELYHRICFPLMRIPYLKRSEYIRIDRGRLRYINLWERLNCMYCGYANGMLAYMVAIAGATERYWCGIKHKSGGGFSEPKHHAEFLAYDDAAALEEFISKS